MTFKELLYGSDRFTPKQEKTRMFAMYFFTGIFTMLANLICFVLFDKLVRAEYNVTIIRWSFDLFLILNQTIAWLAATMTAFFTNRAFVFRSHGNVLIELLGFCAARFATLVFIEIGLFTVLVMVVEHNAGISTDTLIFEIIGFDFTWLYVVKIVNSIVLVAVNYILSRWIVFRRGMKKEDGK
jgi:putative flippase GtrA